jgi:hypothetical protein
MGGVWFGRCDAGLAGAGGRWRVDDVSQCCQWPGGEPFQPWTMCGFRGEVRRVGLFPDP